MKQRWLVVVVGLPALLAVLLACPAWATMLVVCGIAGIAAYELLHTAGENVPANFYWGLVTTVVMQEIWLFKEEMSGTYDLPISTVTIFRWILVMMAFLFAVISYGKEKPFTFHDVAVAIIGGIVFPAMYSCIFLLRMDGEFGKVYVLAPFCVAFAGDALSMYFGMWFGKRKMAPHVSPHQDLGGRDRRAHRQRACAGAARRCRQGMARLCAELPHADPRGRGGQYLRPARRPLDVACQARGGDQGLQPPLPDARRHARPL